MIVTSVVTVATTKRPVELMYFLRESNKIVKIII